tara:strand:+ start:607 stop:1071 length:465 start_codon:yes stop_codon:yes gene_type:complete
MDRKILNWDTLDSTLVSINKEKIVFTNGCFDILHPGHIHILDQAKSYGDILIVGLNSDESIKRLKGTKRPKVSQKDRLRILSSIKFVDYAVLFEEDTPLKLIKKIKPNILVKGGDYNSDDIVGSEFVKSNGGEIKIVQLLEGYSSSSLIDKFEN